VNRQIALEAMPSADKFGMATLGAVRQTGATGTKCGIDEWVFRGEWMTHVITKDGTKVMDLANEDPNYINAWRGFPWEGHDAAGTAAYFVAHPEYDLSMPGVTLRSILQTVLTKMEMNEGVDPTECMCSGTSRLRLHHASTCTFAVEVFVSSSS
jgi:hypothetical protein